MRARSTGPTKISAPSISLPRTTSCQIDIAKKAVFEFYPKSTLQIGEIKGLDLTLQDALDYKYIASAKTAQEIAPLFDIVYKPGFT